jgi:hypothetical protein
LLELAFVIFLVSVLNGVFSALLVDVVDEVLTFLGPATFHSLVDAAFVEVLFLRILGL